MSNVYAVILAAGKGSRMFSKKPKALQSILGEAMISYVYAAIKEYSQEIFTVVGHGAEEIKDHYSNCQLELYGVKAEENCILQNEQLGTGHALLIAHQSIKEKINLQNNDKILVVNGDAPLLTSEIIAGFIEKSKNFALTFLSLNLENPKGYGRVLREKHSEGKVLGIIEEKDFTLKYPHQEIHEVNSGIYLINNEILTKFLPLLSSQNAGQEYYLTDVIELAKQNAFEVEAFCLGHNKALLGVNTAHELYVAEKFLAEQENIKRMNENVLLHHPESIRISPFAKIAKGVEIFGPCEIYGNCQIEQFTCLESHTVIKNSQIGENCQIKSFSHLEEAILENNVTVGPYARLRPGSELASSCKVGNFVEIKKSRLGQGSKVNHLSYIGDASLGTNVNVGAGSITCNYDGVKKHQTIIGDNAFLGSNTAYVAPVKIGKNSLVGAGSVITKDVPDFHLAVSRAEQKIIDKNKLKTKE